MSVYLAYPGMNDMFLTENPEFTYFKTVYLRDFSFFSKTLEIPFNQNNTRPGDTLFSTLPDSGDYISNISLKVVLPDLTPYSLTYINYPPLIEKSVELFDSNGILLNNLTMNGGIPRNIDFTWLNGYEYVLISDSAKYVLTYGGVSFFISNDDNLYATGDNSSGQFGNGTYDSTNTFAQIVSDVKKVSTNGTSVFYINKNGELYGTGFNFYGNLGDGTTEDKNTFFLIATDVIDVSSGYFNTFYVTSNGDLYASGNNASGQFGNGTYDSTNIFIQVASGVSKVFSRPFNTYYLTETGDLYATGDNASGQFGNGTYDSTNTFFQVASDVSKVGAGIFNLFYINSIGELYGTGFNFYGNLGDGTTEDKNTFFLIETDVIDVSSGYLNTFYVTSNGDLYASGDNASGQFGNGTYDSTNIFIQVASDIYQVSSSDFNTLYVSQSGEIYASGNNYYGQFGNGTYDSTNTFVLVNYNYNKTDPTNIIAIENNTFVFLTDVSYVVFDDINLASLFGFSKNPIYLQNGKVKFEDAKTAQFSLLSSNWSEKSNYFYTVLSQSELYGRQMKIFSNDDEFIYSVTFNGLLPTDINTDWLSYSDISYKVLFNSTQNKFSFNETPCFAIFDSIETANLFGFVFNPINLFGGFVKFENAQQSQVTLQECGWINDYDVLNSSNTYLDDTIYKFINSISLYIGKQLVQEFDSKYIKFYKDTTTSYKNRPVYKLLEGNDNIVDFDRVYYFDIPFINIPLYAIKRHNVDIFLKINPFNYFKFYTSLLVSYNVFENKLPLNIDIHVPQIYYHTKEEKMDIRGPIKKLIIDGSIDYSLSLNGEKFINHEYALTSAFDNLKNLPTETNVYVFNNMINMSRIRDQKFVSSNINVYAEVLNVLRCSNDMSGLLFGKTESRPYPILNGNFTNPVGNIIQNYLYNQIPYSVGSIETIFSLRHVNQNYTGPIIRVRNTDTDEEFDLYTDSTQSYLKTIDGVSVSELGSTLRVSVWYDQSIFENKATQKIKTAQPELVFKDGKYVIGMFNSYGSYGFTPNYWFDITTPINPQQFIMVVNLNRLYDYAVYFSGPSNYLRYPNGPFDIGQYPNGIADTDWVKWYGSSEEDKAKMYINNVPSYELNQNTWEVIVSYLPGEVNESDVSILGCSVPDYYTTPLRSFDGYMFEIGWLKNKTMETDYKKYYISVPEEFKNNI